MVAIIFRYWWHRHPISGCIRDERTRTRIFPKMLNTNEREYFVKIIQHCERVRTRTPVHFYPWAVCHQNLILTPIFTNSHQFHFDAWEIHTFYLMKNLHALNNSESLKFTKICSTLVCLSILLCWRLRICYDGALSSSAEASGTDYLRKYKPKCFHKCSILFKVQHFNVLIRWYFRSNSPPK